MTEENITVEEPQVSHETPEQIADQVHAVLEVKKAKNKMRKRGRRPKKPQPEIINAKAENRPDRSKPVRVKLADRHRISFEGMDPDFIYRVVNDQDGRIEKLQEWGYELVESDKQLGDFRAVEGSKMGRAVSKPVGGGITGYLMRTRKEYYEEDQKAKADKVNAIEAALKPVKAKEEYGPGLTKD